MINALAYTREMIGADGGATDLICLRQHVPFPISDLMERCLDRLRARGPLRAISGHNFNCNIARDQTIKFSEAV
jgi:hypothetical protein